MTDKRARWPWTLSDPEFVALCAPLNPKPLVSGILALGFAVSTPGEMEEGPFSGVDRSSFISRGVEEDTEATRQSA